MRGTCHRLVVVALTGDHASFVTDHPLKNSVGAIGWPANDSGSLTGADFVAAGRLDLRVPSLLVITNFCLPFRKIRLGVFRGVPGRRGPPGNQDSYLVDSASSHMLVSKIKPCMSKYKQSIL